MTDLEGETLQKVASILDAARIMAIDEQAEPIDHAIELLPDDHPTQEYLEAASQAATAGEDPTDELVAAIGKLHLSLEPVEATAVVDLPVGYYEVVELVVEVAGSGEAGLPPQFRSDEKATYLADRLHELVSVDLQYFVEGEPVLPDDLDEGEAHVIDGP